MNVLSTYIEGQFITQGHMTRNICRCAGGVFSLRADDALLDCSSRLLLFCMELCVITETLIDRRDAFLDEEFHAPNPIG